MSVANIFLSDHDVRIVSDTCTYCGKQPVEWNRKVTINPRARLAITVRGQCWIGDGLGDLSANWRDFGQAVAETVEVIPMILKLGRVDFGFEVTIAGWQDGPRVTRVIHDDRNGIERYEFAPGVYLAPSLGKQEIPVDLTDAQLGAVAQVQQTLSRKHGLNMCVGGDIERTVISEHGVFIDKIGEYDDKLMMERRIAKATVEMRQSAAA